MKRFVSLLLSISLALLSWVPATNASQYSVISGTITPPPGFTFERFSVWSGTQAVASAYDAATGNYSITGLASENIGIKSISFTLLHQNPTSSGLAKFTGHISLQSSTALTNATVPSPQIMNLTIANAQGQPQAGSKLGISEEFSIVGSSSDSSGNSWKTYFWLDEQTSSDGNFSVWAYPGQIQGEVSARLVSPYARVNLTTFSFPENNGAKICLPINFDSSMAIHSSCINTDSPEPGSATAPLLSSISNLLGSYRQLSTANVSFDISNPQTLQKVRVLLRAQDGSFVQGFNPSLISQTQESWRYSTQILFSPYAPSGIYTLQVDFMHSGSEGNWVSGKVMDLKIEPSATSLSLSTWELDQSSGVHKAQISGTVSDLSSLTRFSLTVCDQTVNLPFGGSLPASTGTPSGFPVRIESSKFDATTGNYSLWLVSASSTETTCQVSMVKDRQNSASELFRLGSTTIPASQPAATGVEQYRGHGPDDGEFSAWTKVLANGTQMKFYAKYLQSGQKVQFMVQNSSGVYEQVAWKRVTESDLADDGAYTSLQNYVYFIRTIDLKPGKNRVRILVDGETVWGTKSYSLK